MFFNVFPQCYNDEIMADQDSARPRQRFQLFNQGLKALVLGSLIFLFLLLCAVTFYQLTHLDTIFPGIHVNGFSIGGMTVEEAAVTLTQDFNLSTDNQAVLIYLDNSFNIDLAELGISIGAVRTAIDAYQFGRSLPISQWIWQQPLIFAKHLEIDPIIVLDQNKAIVQLQIISSRQDRFAREASLSLEGTRVIAISGQIGQILALQEGLDAITGAVITNQLSTINLPVSVEIPNLMDASEYLPMAQSILERPFIIETPENVQTAISRWTITPENLAPMLTFMIPPDGSHKLQPQFVDDTLAGLLASIAEQINAPAENPRFIFNDETGELDLYLDGIPGVLVDVENSQKAIQAALASGNNQAELAVTMVDPEVSNDATAESLGVRELVYMESSFFYGSDAARIQNIQTAANEFLGILVRPGETFSMASAMGDISLDNGYSEALIIYNGKTIEGVGGGVCQVSTTLFRTAFFAGFPINERHPHAYRVSYYEKVAGNSRNSNLAGLDATVYIPLVDLKFTNDTPYWLLMEAYVYPGASRIDWKFYSTDDGRTMEWTTTGLQNTIEADEPIYELNSELDAGEIRQVDWEAEGADVTVSRAVYLDGDILFEDSFFTRYAPWRAVYEYGPGTDGIPKQKND